MNSNVLYKKAYYLHYSENEFINALELYKKIIKESHEFRGTYIFHPGYHQKMKFDMDNIARLMLDEELYEMTKSWWKIKEDEKLCEESYFE